MSTRVNATWPWVVALLPYTAGAGYLGFKAVKAFIANSLNDGISFGSGAALCLGTCAICSYQVYRSLTTRNVGQGRDLEEGVVPSDHENGAAKVDHELLVRVEQCLKRFLEKQSPNLHQSSDQPSRELDDTPLESESSRDNVDRIKAILAVPEMEEMPVLGQNLNLHESINQLLLQLDELDVQNDDYSELCSRLEKLQGIVQRMQFQESEDSMSKTLDSPVPAASPSKAEGSFQALMAELQACQELAGKNRSRSLSRLSIGGSRSQASFAQRSDSRLLPPSPVKKVDQSLTSRRINFADEDEEG